MVRVFAVLALVFPLLAQGELKRIPMDKKSFDVQMKTLTQLYRAYVGDQGVAEFRAHVQKTRSLVFALPPHRTGQHFGAHEYMRGLAEDLGHLLNEIDTADAEHVGSIRHSAFLLLIEAYLFAGASTPPPHRVAQANEKMYFAGSLLSVAALMAASYADYHPAALPTAASFAVNTTLALKNYTKPTLVLPWVRNRMRRENTAHLMKIFWETLESRVHFLENPQTDLHMMEHIVWQVLKTRACHSLF